MLDAILAAVSAAALFAVAAALQHRSAGLISARGQGQVARIAGFAPRTLRHPLWIAGSLASLAGFGLHALALRDGPLTLVQPLLVTGVIFALPLRQILERRRPRYSELGWAVALALGLAVFILVSTPAASVSKTADLRPAVICVAAIALCIPGCCVAGRRATGSAAAAALGTAAGLAFAATAGLLKETVDVVSRDAGALLTTWPGYALVVVGGIGLLLNQLAYQAAAAGQPPGHHHRQPHRQPHHRRGRLRRAVPQRRALPGRRVPRPGPDRRRRRRAHPLRPRRARGKGPRTPRCGGRPFRTAA